MDLKIIAQIAIEAGRILLENGGETARVEETMVRICKSFDISYADSFVTPTGIMFCITDNDGNNISIIKRINNRSINMEKILKVNSLSRNICAAKYNQNEILQELKRIDNCPAYNKYTVLFCAALSTGFFTLMAGGNLKDFIASFLIGFIIKYVTELFLSYNVNSFFVNVLGGATAAILALTLNYINLINNMDMVIIGSIMLLVPGLAITNALRDTISGDIVSGITRAIEAFFVATSIAIGVGFVLKSWILIFGGL
jgi:uncharacterized membrane protein YjjP (DUF1212 family)